MGVCKGGVGGTDCVRDIPGACGGCPRLGGTLGDGAKTELWGDAGGSGGLRVGEGDGKCFSGP